MNGNQPHKNMINIDSRGFTLIEVMIALAIFSIGILGMYALQ
jgi:prepilin-type N-terminal cleavage/methylation domain-containing protein